MHTDPGTAHFWYGHASIRCAVAEWSGNLRKVDDLPPTEPDQLSSQVAGCFGGT